MIFTRNHRSKREFGYLPKPWYGFELPSLFRVTYLWMMLVISIQACAPRSSYLGTIQNDGGVIGIADLYQAGQVQVTKALQTRPGLAKIQAEFKSQLVLVLISVKYDDGEFERIQQSGVFVEAGRYILTAAHGFYIEDGEILEIKVKTISGHELIVNMVNHQYTKGSHPLQDWAILQPSIPFKTLGLPMDTSGKRAKEVLILGFPGSLGLDKADKVVHIHEVQQGPIFPLSILAEPMMMKPHIMIPTAGAIPIRGMSGSPVLDPDGSMVGIFSSVSRTRSLTGWHYVFEMGELPKTTLDSLHQK